MILVLLAMLTVWAPLSSIVKHVLILLQPVSSVVVRDLLVRFVLEIISQVGLLVFAPQDIMYLLLILCMLINVDLVILLV